ncbi:hypothetical protein [Streptomyces sp. NPDC006333]|uniref:hypothetical protein n=1 Tax=Streptomyces sp. NPDC006333 TaxID=3156753 RepID=UPI0033A91EC9
MSVFGLDHDQRPADGKVPITSAWLIDDIRTGDAWKDLASCDELPDWEPSRSTPLLSSTAAVKWVRDTRDGLTPRGEH